MSNTVTIEDVLYFLTECYYDNPSDDNPFTGTVGGWVDQALTQIEAIMEGVIGEELDYEKYGPCPACHTSMMYQCSCDSGSRYTVLQQKARLKAALGRRD